MINQVASVATPRTGFSPKMTPAAVATPLPPLKRKNTGQRCPRKAARPTSGRAFASWWGLPQRATAHTGRKPF